MDPPSHERGERNRPDERGGQEARQNQRLGRLRSDGRRLGVSWRRHLLPDKREHLVDALTFLRNDQDLKMLRQIVAIDLLTYKTEMTGGGALIRGLDVLLAQDTGLTIHVDEDPLTCVVRGTGRILDDAGKYFSVLSA